ncbi:MAG: hypothetical protein RLZZ58_556 [Pseudomonadota bacterium]
MAATLIIGTIFVGDRFDQGHLDFEDIGYFATALGWAWFSAIMFAFFLVGPFAAIVGWTLLRATERRPDLQSRPVFAAVGAAMGALIFLLSFGIGLATALGTVCGAVAGHVFRYSLDRGRV